MNNHHHPARLGVFATIEKFLFRQLVLLMCSVNVEAAKGMSDLVKESSLKVGISMELMEDVLKEPATVEIGTGGGIPDTTSTGPIRGCRHNRWRQESHSRVRKKHYGWKPP